MLFGRFILRFLLVPLGAVAAALVGIAVVMIGEWHAFNAFIAARPDAANDYVIAAMMAAPYLMVTLAGAALTMLAPGAIGILVAEFFAIRSWIFHIANGAISAWVGWSMLNAPRDTAKLFQDPKLILVMGLLAGGAYWLIAGWTAGFWKPVFGREEQLPPAPPTNLPRKSPTSSV